VSNSRAINLPFGTVRAGLLGALLVAPAGCGGGGKAEVTGRVTHQGKAVVVGTVVFQGPDGLAMPGPISADGSYRVTGVAAGKALIGVVSRDPGPTVAAKGRVNTKPGRDPDEAPPAADRRKWFPLPEKYEDPTKSGLSTTLKAGSNEHDIDLP
jgi:hypothetical protein